MSRFPFLKFFLVIWHAEDERGRHVLDDGRAECFHRQLKTEGKRSTGKHLASPSCGRPPFFPPLLPSVLCALNMHVVRDTNIRARTARRVHFQTWRFVLLLYLQPDSLPSGARWPTPRLDPRKKRKGTFQTGPDSFIIGKKKIETEREREGG